jgi:predicted lipoprotein
VKKIGFLFLLIIVFASCRKPKTSGNNISSQNINQAVIDDIATNVVWGSFSDLQSKATIYYNDVNTFNTNPTDNNLTACKASWKNMRQVWEQCEAFLYGPVSTEQFDPKTDTWPVNYTDMDTLLASNYHLTADSIDMLDDALKGYHPMEYMLWGKSSNKKAIDFTLREKQYLMALAQNYKTNVDGLAAAYNTASPNSFLKNIFNAGTSNSIYPTKKAAYLEMITAMAGICDEVANGKMEDPFINQDASLEESPYSQNSLTDFKNNIQGVYNVYNGIYTTDGLGISDVVKQKNISLDNKIQSEISTAISSIQAIKGNFGTAIFTQQNQIINAQQAINNLKNTLEIELINLANQQIAE